MDAYKQEAFQRHEYGMYGLGWFADFVDGDNFLSPFVRDGGFMVNGYENPAVGKLLDRELASTKPTDRAAIFGEIQDIVARDVPVLPLWQGKQIVAVRPGVEGVEQSFDPALQLRLWLVSKR
jgi:peptide/nickel transport system substrate-binding protein